jgi:hypothetical protein
MTTYASGEFIPRVKVQESVLKYGGVYVFSNTSSVILFVCSSVRLFVGFSHLFGQDLRS